MTSYTVRVLEGVLSDIRYALRHLATSPGFAITTISVLAVGIGATTAIFTLVNEMLLKSLPVRTPNELIIVGDNPRCCVGSGLQNNWSMFSYEQYTRFRDRTSGFSSLAAFQSGKDQVGVRREGTNRPAEPFVSEFVSGNAFETLGLEAYAGRLLSPPDDVEGALPVAVMSYHTWQRVFGADRTVLGDTFIISGRPYSIVGIAPPGFYGMRLRNQPASFWIALNSEPLLRGPTSMLRHPEIQWLDIVGRLNHGADPKRIETLMQVELQQFLLDPISGAGTPSQSLIHAQTLRLSPGARGVQRLQDEYKSGLQLLLLLSAFVLLIACANVANLLVARATKRQQEICVRVALGAPHLRLVQQALTESLILALMGGITGIAVAYWGARSILGLVFGKVWTPIHPSPSFLVLIFALALSLLTGILFGVAPLWITARLAPADALREGNRTTKRSSLWMRKTIVTVQMALSLALLYASGMLIRSFKNIEHQQFGFDTMSRYTLHIDPQTVPYKPDQLDKFYREIHATLAAVPGVENVSYSISSPMDGNNWGANIYLETEPSSTSTEHGHPSGWNRVSSGYFDTIGTRIIRGRPILELDDASSPTVAVVNKAFVREYLKNEDPIGTRFGEQDSNHSNVYEIVGVTEDTQYGDSGATGRIRPMYFLSAQQTVRSDDPDYRRFQESSHYMGAIEIKTRGIVPGIEQNIRRALAHVNPDLTVIDFQPFADQVRDSYSQQEIVMKLISSFGIVALLLATVGLYGVTAYLVELRRNEIGLRMALGANRYSVARMVLTSVVAQIGMGFLIGFPVSMLGGRILASQLVGLGSYDVVMLVSAALPLAIIGLLATLAPAYRAASIEPMQALRNE